MNKILIIAPYQFGELSDCYYWAKYARMNYEILYMGYRQRTSKITQMQLEGVDVWEPIKFKNTKLFGLYFYLNVFKTILFSKIDNVIICNMPYADFLPRIFRKKNIVFDIRTLSVSPNPKERLAADKITKRRASNFKKISVISEGIINKIALKKTYLLPLGAEEISLTNKNFDIMRLMYIGTFNGRNLDEFLEGLLMFKNKTHIPFTFDIIGMGDSETTQKMVRIASQIGPEVKFHGYLNHEESKCFFDKCNVGVCYVPITEYYEYQPATKLYEYFLSGLACIATSTISIKKDMLFDCGVLTKDNPYSVCSSLEALYQNFSNYNSSDIRIKAKRFHWRSIIDNYFKPLFSKK